MSDSESVYRAIFQAAPDGVLVVDDHGVIVEVNRAAVELFGYSADELIGQPVEVLVPEGRRAGHDLHRQGFAARPLARPMGAGLALTALCKGGRTIPVEISLSPVTTEGKARVIASVRDMRERIRLQNFGAGALRASEDERRRIARELHDDTAQRLAALMVRLRLLEDEGSEAPRRKSVEELRDGLKACAEGVRRIARGLRPAELEAAGLLAAIRSHVQSIGDASSVDIVVDGETVDHALSSEGRLILYRIVQEALSNALRHGEPGTVRVTVQLREDHVHLLVGDDGRGFLLDQVGDGEGEGLGLMGMRERAAMVGGILTVESRPGEGTRIEVQIPTGSVREVSHA